MHALTFDEEAALALVYQTGTGEERRAAGQKLIVANDAYLATIARRFIAVLEFDDAHQIARLALLKGAEKFDPSKGVALRNYAAWWARSWITNEVHDAGGTFAVPRGTDWRIRRAEREGTLTPYLQRLRRLMGTLSLETPIRAGGRETIGDHVRDRGPLADETLVEVEEEALLRRGLTEALASLHPRRRGIIERLFLADEPETMEQIADSQETPVTREAIRQQKEKALRSLRLALRAKGLRMGDDHVERQ